MVFSQGVSSQMLVDVQDLSFITMEFSEISCEVILFTEAAFKKVVKISFYSILKSLYEVSCKIGVLQRQMLYYICRCYIPYAFRVNLQFIIV